jgi:hypothetical protein
MNKYIIKLKEAGIELPDKHIHFLLGESFNNKFKVDDNEDPFNIYNTKELLTGTNIDGESYIIAESLIGYAKTLIDIMGDNTSDQNGEEYSLEQLSKGIVIGDENGRLLFIDSEDNSSLYIFHPDGGDVEKTEKSINDL